MTDHRPMRLHSPVATSRPAPGHPTDLRLTVRGLVAAVVGQMPVATVEAATASVCTLAREQDVTIERVIVMLRAEWDAADKPSAMRAERGEALRARLVSHCIRDFYEKQT